MDPIISVSKPHHPFLSSVPEKNPALTQTKHTGSGKNRRKRQSFGWNPCVAAAARKQMMEAPEAFHSHPKRRQNMLGMGSWSRDFSVRLLSVQTCLHTLGISKKRLLRAIKDPAKVLICFGTSAEWQKDTDQPVLPSLENLWLGWISWRSGCQQWGICGDAGDENFLPRLCDHPQKMWLGQVQKSKECCWKDHKENNEIK